MITLALFSSILFFAKAILTLTSLAILSTKGAPVVTDITSGAKFFGTFSSNKSAEVFKGIRYATIPKRFAVAVQSIYNDGEIYNATSFGPRCFQQDYPGSPPAPSVSEDCLMLNIWRPFTIPKNLVNKSNSLLPVAVWIHGGGYTSGSGSDWSYDGAKFSSLQNIVVVTINYRLGPLGFLCEDSVCTGGMNGMMDQIIALEWIQSHIESFGGNPSLVSIFGQSAGGSSVCCLIVSPRASGLFKRAIIESGACVGDYSPPNASSGSTGGSKWISDIAGATSKKDLQDVARFPMDIFIWNDTVWPSYGDPLGVLQQRPEDLFLSGSVHVDGLMLGANTFDGSAPFILENDFLLPTRADYEAAIKAQYPGWTAAQLQQLIDLYDPIVHFNGSYNASYTSLLGDRTTFCPSRDLANVTAALGTSTYFYIFGHLYPRDLALQFGIIPYDTAERFPTWGSTYSSHEAEIVFVLGNTDGPLRHAPSQVDIPFSPAEECLWQSIASSWASFMRTGQPNTSGVGHCPSHGTFPYWPSVQGGKSEMMGLFLSEDSHALPPNFRDAKCTMLLPHGVFGKQP